MIATPSIAHAFEQNSNRYVDKPFLRDKRNGGWSNLSWTDVARAARHLRAGLLGLGLKPGDRVAILSENCPQWVIADLAALGMGAVVVPLYPTSSSDEIEHVLNDSGARAIAVNGAEHLKRIAAITGHLPQLGTIITLHPDPPPSANSTSPALVSMEALSGGPEAGLIEANPSDIATIIYTSGTTGDSKGVVLSHGNILANCDAAMAALDLGERDEVLSILPVAHSFERTAGYYTVMTAGGTISYAEGLGQIAQNLVEINPSVVLTVPRLLEVIHGRILRTVEKSPAVRRHLFDLALATGKKAAAYRFEGRTVPPQLAAPMALFRKVAFARINALFGKRLRYLISGGAPLPREIFEFFAAAEVPIVEGYGLTEAAPVVSVNLTGRTRPGTVGQPLKGIEVRLGPDNELLVRGPNVMRGYYKLEEDTRAAIDADGWLHTGDIAAIDAQGFISIRDRKKEIIVLSGGKNVSPAALENKLGRIPLIAQACVVGDRRKHVAALLVPNFEHLGEQLKGAGIESRSPQALVEDPRVRALFQKHLHELNRNLADYEAIAAFRLMPKAFSQEAGEITPTLKLRRRVILERYRREVESMYE
jgi:long-chain acyl-CoA synthetase